LGMDLSRRKKKSAVPAVNRSTAPGGGVGAPQRQSKQLAGKGKANELASSGRLIRGRKQAPSAYRRVRASAHECIGSHGRTSCFLQPASRSARGRGDIRGCFSRVRRPVSAKWSLKLSHRFRPV
jgi:hypothetical protein